MDTQTKDCELPDEFWDNMRWIDASIARSWRELDEMHELAQQAGKDLEAVVGPIPKA
jgi:hypothetical protein